MRKDLSEKIRAILFGHAVGDAVGGPVQFEDREVRDEAPVTDMMPFRGESFPKGAWSDDTSMSLCAMDAIIKHGLDFEAVMENFRKWMYDNEFTPTGVAFDIGMTCYIAIERSLCAPAEQCGCHEEFQNGNGSLMRLYPFVLYLDCTGLPLDEKISLIRRASSITHAHPRTCIGCGIYAFVMWELLQEPTKKSIRTGLKKAEAYYRGDPELQPYLRLFDAEFELLPRFEIMSSGYVVHTLEAAVWCALTTDNFRDCILTAVNLGEDTDTVAAVAGSLAGLLYGYDGIPEDWRNSLCKKEYLEEIGQAFCQKLLSL